MNETVSALLHGHEHEAGLQPDRHSIKPAGDTWTSRALAQLGRLYSFQSRINAAIVRLPERDALLREACRIAVRHGGFALAAVALLDEAGAWSWTLFHGDTRAAPAGHDDFAAWLSCGSGTVLRMDARPAQVALRLRAEGSTVGLLGLLARKPEDFDAPMLRMLEETSDDLSFALENIARETVRRKTEDKLRKLSRAVEQSANAVMITDRAGMIEYVNPCFTRITGYTAEEAIGATPSLLKSAATHPDTWRTLWSTISSGRDWSGEMQNTRKNGERYWSLNLISPLKDDDGNITHFVSVSEDISARKESEQTIRHLAFHDALTGLPNRRLFNDRLQQAVAQHQVRGSRFGMMLFDLDRFKTVNDSLGHELGDLLLKEVAARLQAQVREGDTLARMGGDEFGLIAHEAAMPGDMARLAEKLFGELRRPFGLDGHEVYVSASAGITLFPADAGEADALVRNADIALYRAKDGGRSGYQFFTGDMGTAALQRLRLESALRGALDRQELFLVYQPQADVVTGRIRGCEALVRWRHPDFGMVSPQEFIPLAEETGMILPIGAWVLRTACAQARQWRQAGLPLRVAVNLSAHQFHYDDLARTVAAILDEHALPAELLELELTEGTLMKDNARTAQTLRHLHEMGVQISIDDFGTGYSSLSYLKRLPIQLLKIDQSFVREIHTDADDRAIVTAVIALAHSMKLKVVAEGVETAEQHAFLRDHRCDMLQGYLFSRPVPGAEILSMLQAQNRPA